MTTSPVTTITDELLAELIEYHDSDAETGTPCSVTEYEIARELRTLRAENAEQRRALFDLCDGFQWFDIAEQTGLEESRCREILAIAQEQPQ